MSTTENPSIQQSSETRTLGPDTSYNIQPRMRRHQYKSRLPRESKPKIVKEAFPREAFNVRVETKNGVKGVIRFTPTDEGWVDSLISEYHHELWSLVHNEYVSQETQHDVLDWLRCDFKKVNPVQD